MTPTVYDAGTVVNPDVAHLGEGIAGLYDWLRLRTRPGRTRRVEELTPPAVPRYEQLAAVLRRAIVDGTFPEKASGPSLARHYDVSQAVVQKAFEALQREGLLSMEPGRRTAVAARKRWEVEVGVRLPEGDSDAAMTAAARLIRVLLAEAAGRQPAVSSAAAERVGDGVRVRVTVEAADPFGAVAALAPVMREACGSLPIVVMSTREAPA